MTMIKHSGEVVRIEATTVYVKLTVSSACSGCHAKAVCGVDESEEKIVEVEDVVAFDFKVGDIVEVALQSGTMGTKAVVLTYVVPFFVLAILLFGSVALGAGEGVSALVSLAGVVVYYLVRYALRDKIKEKIKFIIIK